MNKLHLFILLLLTISCNSQVELSKEEIVETAQLYTRQFYSNDLQTLHPLIHEKSFTLQHLKDFRILVENELGHEIAVYDEIYEDRIWKDKVYHGYVRYSEFSRADRPVKTVFAFDSRKVIYRFEVVLIPDHAYSRFENYQTKTRISLPFEGEWLVASGGRSSMYNHHTISVDQRYACDFIIEKNDISYANSGRKNEDYHCFNQRVLSPGAGTIVDVVNHIAENKIGQMPPETSGNRVIIDHHNGEYSILSHFKKGSVVVSPGEEVKSGQYLGLCGNSGRSFGPHIHFHMQNSPVMYEGEGLPIRFTSFYSDNSFIDSGELEYGRKVRNH